MQQINLYLPEFRPKQDWLKLEFTLLFAIVFLLAMSSYHIAMVHKHRATISNVSELEVKVKTLAEQAKVLKVKPSTDESALLAQKAENLRRSIKNRQAIAAVISGQVLGNQNGFSQYLNAMGEQMVNDVALTSFEFTQGGRFASLAGVAVKPESIPLYVSKLQSSKAFKDTKFGYLTIEKSSEGAKFELTGNLSDGQIADKIRAGGKKK